MTSRPTDERRTPRWFFEACDGLWGPYDVDCFAARWNRQVEQYFTRERSFYDWRGRARRGWVQPPYSRGQLFRALGHVRHLVLEGRLQLASCLVPVDQSTEWWERHVSRPEGRRRGARWVQLPQLFSAGSHQLVSHQLAVTIAPVTTRLAFECPPGTPLRDLQKMHGAKQPSVVVTFERRAA